MTMFVHTVIG